MGLDFWAVKIKKNVNEKDFKFGDYWDLIENDRLNDTEGIVDFFKKQNDKQLYSLCKETVNYFVGGDPIYINSSEDINTLADKLNLFIKENPDYVYEDEGCIVYPNDEVKKFIKYINLVKDNGFVLWCSW